MILAIDTSGQESYMGLMEDGKELIKKRWSAGRELSKTLLGEIAGLLEDDWPKLDGIVVFEGPGSFTGLRIGITTANAIAYAQDIPIAGGKGKSWIAEATAKLAKTQPGQYVLPEYGAPANTTQPKR